MIPSPNIWDDPDVYEIENLGVDPDGLIEAAMAGVHDWSGRRVLDVGCGSGFHLPRFAQTASAVVGFEPYEPLATLARQRISNKSLTNVSVLDGAAQELPLADDSVDVVHARWAYFFGPGCEPGLAEVTRTLRPGGTAFVIDNDASRSTFGAWFRRAMPTYDPLRLNASGPGRAGRESLSTCNGPSSHAQTSSRSCGSSSPRPWPTASWPNTRVRTWTTQSTCGGAPSSEIWLVGSVS